MKMPLAVTLSLSLLGTAATAEPSPVPGPRPGTVEALQCLVHQGPPACEGMLLGGARLSANSWGFRNHNAEWQRGPVVSGNFRRRATTANGCDAMVLTNRPTNEMDIFDVKFAHGVGFTFYISPADANGKIDALSISLWPHDNQLCDR